MNLLDENIPDEQRRKLQSRKMRVQQIGYDASKKGVDDKQQIVPLLHRVKRVCFFTRDNDFYKQSLLYKNYCIVYLDIVEDFSAVYVLRFIKHKEFNTVAKQLGEVIWLAPEGIHFWHIGNARRQFEA